MFHLSRFLKAFCENMAGNFKVIVMSSTLLLLLLPTSYQIRQERIVRGPTVRGNFFSINVSDNSFLMQETNNNLQHHPRKYHKKYTKNQNNLKIKNPRILSRRASGDQIDAPFSRNFDLSKRRNE